MTVAQCARPSSRAPASCSGLATAGCNVVGFGEMGIGNTASASLLTHCLTGAAGRMRRARHRLDDAGLARKQDLLDQALVRYRNGGGDNDPFAVLAEFGGFEIATMVGAMLAAAEAKMVLLIDGFIVGSAALSPASPGAGPARLLRLLPPLGGSRASARNATFAMGAEPLLDLGLRLGEGTGAALAYPLVQSAVAFLNEDGQLRVGWRIRPG